MGGGGERDHVGCANGAHRLSATDVCIGGNGEVLFGEEAGLGRKVPANR